MADSGCLWLGMRLRVAAQHGEGGGYGVCSQKGNMRGTFSVSPAHYLDLVVDANTHR